VLAHTHFAVPSVEVFSNTTAAPYPREPNAIRELLTEHLVRPVRFADQIEAMYAAGARVFVEVGPGNVLTRLVGQTLGERPHTAVAVDLPRRNGLTQLQHALAQLAAHGVTLQLGPLFAGRGARGLNLDALEQETKNGLLSPTTWLVNGSRARLLNEPVDTPLPLLRPSITFGDNGRTDGIATAEAPATKSLASGRSDGSAPVSPPPRPTHDDQPSPSSVLPAEQPSSAGG